MAKFELYKSSNGEYRWRLRADNGNIIATGGEGYASKATAQAGIESVKRTRRARLSKKSELSTAAGGREA
jgi:uncharacterized protein YegP (UPF0339 family)